MTNLLRVTDFRARWSLATDQGAIDIALNRIDSSGNPTIAVAPLTLGPLSDTRFAALMALLTSGDRLFFDIEQNLLFSPE